MPDDLCQATCRFFPSNRSLRRDLCLQLSDPRGAGLLPALRIG